MSTILLSPRITVISVIVILLAKVLLLLNIFTLNWGKNFLHLVDKQNKTKYPSKSNIFFSSLHSIVPLLLFPSLPFFPSFILSFLSFVLSFLPSLLPSFLSFVLSFFFETDSYILCHDCLEFIILPPQLPSAEISGM